MIHRYHRSYILLGALLLGFFLIRAAMPKHHPAVAGYKDARINPDYSGHWGYINKDGAVVISPRFQTALEFHNGYAAVNIRPHEFGNSGLPLEAVIDKRGNVISKALCCPTGEMNDGLMPVLGLTEKNRNYEESRGVGACSDYEHAGYLRADGKLTFQFNQCGDFRDGIAVVKDSNGIESAFRTIDTSFKTIAPLPGIVCDMSISEGLIPVATRAPKPKIDKYSEFLFGYADTKGRMVIPFKFASAQPFSCGRAIVRYPGAKTNSLINRSGCCVATTSYEVIGDFQDGIACAVAGEKMAVIDTNGAVLSTHPLGSMKFSEGLFSVRHDHGTSFYDKNGAEVIYLKDAHAESFHEGLCAAGVKTDGKFFFGFVNKKGDWVIKPQFNRVGDFSEGLAAVSVERSTIENLKQNLLSYLRLHVLSD